LRVKREAQFPHRSEDVLLGGTLPDANGLCDFADRTAFEVPERKRHALERTHRVHRRLYLTATVRTCDEALRIRRG
jgi:hypothetical protein